jgi:hypothetical protein
MSKIFSFEVFEANLSYMARGPEKESHGSLRRLVVAPNCTLFQHFAESRGELRGKVPRGVSQGTWQAFGRLYSARASAEKGF